MHPFLSPNTHLTKEVRKINNYRTLPQLQCFIQTLLSYLWPCYITLVRACRYIINPLWIGWWVDKQGLPKHNSWGTGRVSPVIAQSWRMCLSTTLKHVLLLLLQVTQLQNDCLKVGCLLEGHNNRNMVRRCKMHLCNTAVISISAVEIMQLRK